MIRELTNMEIERFGHDPVLVRYVPKAAQEWLTDAQAETIREQYRRAPSGLILPMRYDTEEN